jgi:hypothetical protein
MVEPTGVCPWTNSSKGYWRSQNEHCVGDRRAEPHEREIVYNMLGPTENKHHRVIVPSVQKYCRVAWMRREYLTPI